MDADEKLMAVCFSKNKAAVNFRAGSPNTGKHPEKEAWMLTILTFKAQHPPVFAESH